MARCCGVRLCPYRPSFVSQHHLSGSAKTQELYCGGALELEVLPPVFCRLGQTPRKMDWRTSQFILSSVTSGPVWTETKPSCVGCSIMFSED